MGKIPAVRPVSVLAAAAAPLLLVFHFLVRVFWLGLNQRNILTMPLNFCVNFSPVFVWLLIFKNAGLIPHDIRPRIHVALAYHMDRFMFSMPHLALGLAATIGLTILGGWLLYLRFCRVQRHKADAEMATNLAFDVELDDLEEDKPGLKDFQHSSRIPDLEFFRPVSPLQVHEAATAINAGLAAQAGRGYAPLEAWVWAPAALFAASWFLLNIDQYFAEPLRFVKDQLAWISYVMGHICVPIFVAVWLYVFQAPGALRLFSFALGGQNIAGVLTHLLFPNAPPWFIHLNGEHAHADYNTEGYAAGLTRAKFSTGTHLVTNGFHKLPIVFGALPLLHLAMAVQCFFFVAYYARWRAAKAALFAYVWFQWWATIYLDHHWRLDLFVGLMYAIVAFYAVHELGMPLVNRRFAHARLRFHFGDGLTMGMRVFRNTCWQWFFDPMA